MRGHNSHHARSVVGSSIVHATSRPSRHTPPAGLTLRPVFTQPAPAGGDQPFVGREWLYRDLVDCLLKAPLTSQSVRCVLVHGTPGTGKTTLLHQLLAHSPFFETVDNASIFNGSSICASQASLNSSNNGWCLLRINTLLNYFQAHNNQ
jgi:hypothetical protein